MNRSFGAALGHGVMLACAWLVTSLAPAHAAVDFEQIDPTLKDLRFGQGWDAIAEWVGKRLDKVYQPRIARTSDGNERARLRARRDQELVLMKNAEVLFDGKDSSLDGSIIAGEFGCGTDESLFQYKEGDETHFFFMHGGKLWKYARALGDGPSFNARIATFQNAFGAPAGMTDESDGQGARHITSVVWKNAGFDMRLSDKRVVYAADLFVIEDRDEAAALVALRAKVKAPGLGSKVDPSVQTFLLDDPDTYGAPPKPPDEPPPDGKKPKDKQQPPKQSR